MAGPVLSRPLFAGGRPPAKGLTSLVEGEAPEQALTQVAGSVDKFQQNVDAAQNPEQLMDVIRGDRKPVEARYAELAQFVGPQDAQATPLSVLTLAQPAIDLLSGKGVASLLSAYGGDADQDPQQDMPQGYADGGLVGQVTQLMGPERSLGDMYRERAGFLGQGMNDSDSYDRNMALMQYGSEIANTPGGILTALTKPMGNFAQSLSAINQRRAALDMKIKEGTLDAHDQQRALRMKAQLDALATQYQQGMENARQDKRLQFEGSEKEKDRLHDFTKMEKENEFATGRQDKQLAATADIQTSVTAPLKFYNPTTGEYRTGVRRPGGKILDLETNQPLPPGFQVTETGDPAGPKNEFTPDYKNYLQTLQPGEAPTGEGFQKFLEAKGKNSATRIDLGGDKRADIMIKEKDAAQKAYMSSVTLGQAQKILNSSEGFYGWNADTRLALAKAYQYVTGDTSLTPDIMNDERWLTQIAPIVASTLKDTVGSNNISNTDLKFSERASGGSLEYNKESILWVMDALRRINEAKVKNYEQMFEEAYPDNGDADSRRDRAMFKLRRFPEGTLAPVEPAAGAQAAPQAPIITTPSGKFRKIGPSQYERVE